MPPDVSEVLSLAKDGANLALVVCAWFIYKAADRLARVETALLAILNKLNLSADAEKLQDTKK